MNPILHTILPQNVLYTAFPCEGDMNLDHDVDGVDLAIFAEAYDNNTSLADLDNDADVDGVDLAIFAQDYGRDNCP